MTRLIFIFAATFALFVGCKPSTSNTEVSVGGNKATGEERKVYPTRGVVKEMVSPTRAKIAHEEIPNYMKAMTMPLDVKNANEFAGLKVGDFISFDMIVTKDDGWIENVKRIGTAPVINDTNGASNIRIVKNVPPVSVGEIMPDYSLADQEGKKIKLSDFRGQALAFSFIFTRCPFPTFCPRMNTNFEKAAKELTKSGSPTNWHLLSISFDTEVDTPEQLKKYATRYERDPAKWSFATGELSDIDALTQQVGLVLMKRSGTIDHNLRTVIVDSAGKIQKMYLGNEWSVEEFVEEMKKAAEAKGP